MNVDEALRQFAEGDGLPREAMAWALANWEAASPRFVARLRAFAFGGDRTEAAESQVFAIVHLCGQMRETRAYEPLCRLIADDADIEIWLGDAMDETLPGVLISVFDGDAGPLLTAIESPAGDEYARGAALAALGYLARAKGVLDDETMRELLRRLRREALPREIPGFWFSWAETAAALGYEDLKMEAALLAKDGLLDAVDFGLVDFEQAVARARSDPAGLAGFHDQKVLPFADAIGTLDSWSQGDEEDIDLGDDIAERAGDEAFSDDPFGEPHINPFRAVGRNDPCPCGSGKKFKKCCLAS
ncbi:DUF1186 domain-containing protein [Roseiarcus sp.]|uniref:DUF1186 domain-containing protein n=1 Tax=Roseiarcus sp. TaxID=1969460 RepID=UPI003F946B24